MKNILKKYENILKYGMVSVFTAIIETIIGWGILKLSDVNIVTSNTIAIILGALLHYILTAVTVFNVKRDLRSFTIYVVTFIIGMCLQNLVVWIFYQLIFSGNEKFLVYVFSKGMSLAIPFFGVYYLREAANKKFANREE